MSALKRLDEREWPSSNKGAGPYRDLYVIQEEDSGPVKIGIAANAVERRVTLQGGNPRKLIIRAIYRGADKANVAAIEKALHAHFATARVVNEWFDIEPEVVCELIETGTF